MWVALTDCRLDEETWKPLGGHVVDNDSDFGRLNERLQQRRIESVTIVFLEPQSVLPTLRHSPLPTHLPTFAADAPAESSRNPAVLAKPRESHVRSLITGLRIRGS